jgi:hypothetical protein
MARNTLTISEVGRLIGLGRTGAYAAAAEGSIAGVSVIRVRRRMVVPLRPLAEVLGMTPAQVEDALLDTPRDMDPSGTPS